MCSTRGRHDGSCNVTAIAGSSGRKEVCDTAIVSRVASLLYDQVKMLDFAPPPSPPSTAPLLSFGHIAPFLCACAFKSRAEYRSYCERICGGDSASVEDTLSLQLERTDSRTGPQYDALAGDAVVGLASISMTLSSRHRLAVNGTVESIGRLLARSMCEGGAGGGGTDGNFGSNNDSKGGREALRNLVRRCWCGWTTPPRPSARKSARKFGQ